MKNQRLTLISIFIFFIILSCSGYDDSSLTTNQNIATHQLKITYDINTTKYSYVLNEDEVTNIQLHQVESIATFTEDISRWKRADKPKYILMISLSVGPCQPSKPIALATTQHVNLICPVSGDSNPQEPGAKTDYSPGKDPGTATNGNIPDPRAIERYNIAKKDCEEDENNYSGGQGNKKIYNQKRLKSCTYNKVSQFYDCTSKDNIFERQAKLKSCWNGGGGHACWYLENYGNCEYRVNPLNTAQSI